ncbi:MAG TPA: ABC transporter ATP-binding protein [bacterium]|nr:ABC transporter ATP-binding protein [bacterium]
MNYNLNKSNNKTISAGSMLAAGKKMWPYLRTERNNIILAAVAILTNSGLALLSPYLIGQAIDKYVLTKQFDGVLRYGGILLVVYLIAFAANYAQTRIMGGVGQRTLFNLRKAIFEKLQELPQAFFIQNKAGDLISRINNDTDKLNQFFSQSLMQFMGNFFIIVGAGILVIIINWRLGTAALVPALLLLIFAQIISPWIKQKNKQNLAAIGGLSAEIQESLENFKVIVAFNRRDYFQEKFEEANNTNYLAAIYAGFANKIFFPTFGLAANVANIIVLLLGIYLISHGWLTIGLLVSFLSYTNNIYDPLRQMASLWENLQIALAAWDRIYEILSLQSNLTQCEEEKVDNSLSNRYVMQFQSVFFGYPEGKNVLKNVCLQLEAGKTYALVGPTGGGKTTTASLMARLYDPTQGKILLDGKDIRSFSAKERTQKIGFILQEPFLFSGTVRENLIYGHPTLQNEDKDQLQKILDKTGLTKLLERFGDGLETEISNSNEALSLGQKQLVAFMRAILREPEILILDEATANIDTVTEQLLEEILDKLPSRTTKVIIAHRLNTIENADEIYFVNKGEITMAGSMQQALEMLMAEKRES